jgi:LPS O-antigen subunit length determinant protein (WzzB/FepE family)
MAGWQIALIAVGAAILAAAVAVLLDRVWVRHHALAATPT